MGSIFNLDSPVVKWLERVADMFILNIMYLVFCIPVVTIGAATTALYRVFLNYADGNDAGPIKQFWAAFKSNFKQSTLLFLIMPIPLAGVTFYLFLLFEGILINSFLVTVIGIWAVAAITILWSFLWPMQAQFDNNIKNTLKNAALLPNSNLLRALLMAFINFFPLMLFMGISESAETIAVIWTFFGFSLSAKINTRIFRKVTLRVLNAQAEARAEKEGKLQAEAQENDQLDD